MEVHDMCAVYTMYKYVRLKQCLTVKNQEKPVTFVSHLLGW